MLKNKTWGFVLALGLLSSTVSVDAQDFHLSQYDAPPMFLNPAMTGHFNGKYRLHGHYRTQWSAVSSKPFTTALLSYDQAIKQWGVGAQIINNRAGTGNYNVLGFSVSGSYDQVLDKNEYHFITGGLQLGFMQKSIDFSRLSFGNQYSVSGGGGFDSNLPSGEAGFRDRMFIGDINLGVMYYFGKEITRVNPFAGYSLFHVNQPTETFYNNNGNKLPMRHVFHAGAKVNVNDKLQLVPKFIHMTQENNNELFFSLIMNYYISAWDLHLIAGPHYRTTKGVQDFKWNSLANKDAFALELGGKYKEYIGRISYDINISDLNNSTNGRGGFEISVTYIPTKRKDNPIPICPRL